MKRVDDVIIVGAGLAGLCCARRLHQEGVPFAVFDAADSVGGRVRTDFVEGFLLDRGFQIFLTAYPEAKAILDYTSLDFGRFYSGALVFSGGRFHRVADPIRHPAHAIETIISPVGTLADKLRVACLPRFYKDREPNEELLVSAGDQSSAMRSLPASRETHCAETKNHVSSTRESLRSKGFSDKIIEQFFRPFLGGIFLESNLDTRSSVFEFVFAMLASGDNVLPAAGMQAIPQQIASHLPIEKILLNQRVESISGTTIKLASGEQIHAPSVVLATEEPECCRLAWTRSPQTFHSQTCVYFATGTAPIDEPILVLNGDANGLVNNLCVPSNVSPSYAPVGQALVSASLIGLPPLEDKELVPAVKSELETWFGKQVASWHHLRTYRIKYAIPDQSKHALSMVDRRCRIAPHVYSCGDYKETGSINGAMVSGRKAAEALIADWRGASNSPAC